MRRDAELASTLVVLMNSGCRGQTEDLLAAASFAPDACITKPLNPMTVVAAVKQLLDGHGGDRSADGHWWVDPV